jgi:TRAP-type C4-dicarboxylate transport system substrate-binding protein
MIRKILVVGAVSAAAYALIGTTPAVAEDTPKVDLTMSTLAPVTSPWGKRFTAWANIVKEDTKGAVTLTWYWNGTKGSGTEQGMIEGMRQKNIDGAAITASGLSKIKSDVLALQVPGPYSTWAKLDAGRNAIQGQLNEMFQKEGFTIGGVGDVGIAHIMSKGDPIKAPTDLKSRKTFYIAGDPVAEAFLGTIGARQNPIGVNDILPKLTSGDVDVVNTPSLAAEQFQWSTKMDSINTMPSGIAIGALVFYSGPGSKFAGLGADVKAKLLETAKNTGASLTQHIRQKDAEAYDRLTKQLKKYDPSPAEVAAWQEVFAQTRNKVKGKYINPALMDTAINAANSH